MFRKLLNYMSKYSGNPLNRETLLQNMVIMEGCAMQFREHQSHISSIKMFFNHRTNEKRNMNPSHNSLKIRMPINHLFLINLTFLRQ